MTLEQLAESIDFDASLVRDDFLNDGQKLNLQGQSHWAIRIKHKSQVFQTEYHQGSSYREYRGKKVQFNWAGRYSSSEYQRLERSKPIVPTVLDVMSCLVSEAQCVEYCDFEDWCDGLGYDTDSRKAEKFYYACCETRGKLNGMFNLKHLCELFQDY